MDLFVFVFLSGIVAGLLIAGLLMCAVYFVAGKRVRQPVNNDVKMQASEAIMLSSSIPSIAESSTPIFLVDEGTGTEFSYVPSRANRLGSGGFGVVFKGRCFQSQSEVAIKLVGWHAYRNVRKAQKYFKREVETLKVGSRTSLNVAKFFGSVMNDAWFALVNEYCDLGDMTRWLEETCGARRWGSDLATVLEAYVQIASGLLALHNAGVVHRDLKGSNVFVTSRAASATRARLTCKYPSPSYDTEEERYHPKVPSTVKIGDFGTARILGDSEELTKGVGTEAYMAPEVKRGGTYGVQSDLYSLGVMLKKDLAPAKFHRPRRSDHKRAILNLTHFESTQRPSLETFIAALSNFSYCSNEVDDNALERHV